MGHMGNEPRVQGPLNIPRRTSSPLEGQNMASIVPERFRKVYQTLEKNETPLGQASSIGRPYEVYGASSSPSDYRSHRRYLVKVVFQVQGLGNVMGIVRFDYSR